MAPSLPPTLPEHSSGDSLASPLPPPPMAGRILYNPYSSSKKKPSQHQQQQPPPQKQPFLGGAEMARRNARKKTATRIWRPGEQQQLRKKEQDSEELPKNMNIYDRFFGALLRSSASEFHKAAASSNGGGGTTTTEAAGDVVWHALCRRLGLAHMIPQQPIASTYHDAKVHFGVRAALVLEEARESISAALVQRWKQQKSRANGGSSNSGRHRSIATVLHFIEGKSRHTGLAVVHFRKMSPLSREELFHVRPGSMFECVPRDNPNLANVVLGVVSSSNRDEAENKHIVSLLVLSGDTVCEGRDEWLVTPLCSLISELRQFEACTRAWSEANLPFLRSILGGSAVAKGTHVRFESESDEEKENEVRVKKELKDDDHNDEEEEDADKVKKEDDDDEEDDDDDDIQVVAPPGHIAENAFSLPTLNKTQERAASTFLNSAPSTVTIIQGPPGTGKTTLLISIICRYLLESTNNHKAHPRLLVCAPTNKAITVLATRFLQATKNSVVFNTVLVGDADKLLVDERSAKETSSMTTKLRSIFVYQWMPAILDEYLSIRKFVDGKNDDNRNDPQMCREMVEKAQTLQQKLARSLCGLPQDVLENTISICNTLLQWTTSPTTPVAKTLVKEIDQLIADLKTLIPEAIYKELVSTAHVLFCTLASAGGMVIKSTNPVHDLIVDEAAAATEPDLYIPFHLSPHRLLVVGDPLQLPATVLSRRAIELGLSKSLHERLMYDCKHEHIMLDVQYRMKPDISSFPSHRFYKGMLTNGENVQSPSYHNPLSILDGRPYTFLQVDGVEKQVSNGSYQNPAEAFAVIQLIKQLREAAVHNPALRNSWHGAERLRVITFYQAQVSLIKTMCNDAFGPHVVVATVDSSQGCEADIVIVSFVRDARTNKSGFLSDDRRMNVALTRAKYQLICVGNARGMAGMDGEAELTLKLLANNAQERECIRLSSGNGPRQASLDAFMISNKRQRTFY